MAASGDWLVVHSDGALGSCNSEEALNAIFGPLEGEDPVPEQERGLEEMIDASIEASGAFGDPKQKRPAQRTLHDVLRAKPKQKNRACASSHSKASKGSASSSSGTLFNFQRALSGLSPANPTVRTSDGPHRRDPGPAETEDEEGFQEGEGCRLVVNEDEDKITDLPCSWPWGEVPKDPEPAAPETKPKGRGRGRGRGRGASKGSKGADVGPPPKTVIDEKEKAKVEKTKKGPFLLTNLVRVGNQMRGASTWSILQNALQKVIAQKLVLLPLSSRPQSALDHLKVNIEILTFLGKLPPGFDFKLFESQSDACPMATSKKQSAVMESASELLRRHCCCWCQCHVVSPEFCFSNKVAVEGFGLFMDFMARPACCLDPGFGRPLQASLRNLSEPEAFQIFLKVAHAASRSARLGIFQLECAHHINKTLTQSSDQLGAAKHWLKMSAESLLNSISIRHQRLFAEFETSSDTEINDDGQSGPGPMPDMGSGSGNGATKRLKRRKRAKKKDREELSKGMASSAFKLWLKETLEAHFSTLADCQASADKSGLMKSFTALARSSNKLLKQDARRGQGFGDLPAQLNIPLNPEKLSKPEDKGSIGRMQLISSDQRWPAVRRRDGVGAGESDEEVDDPLDYVEEISSSDKEDAADAEAGEELEDAVCPEALVELMDEICVDDAFSDHDTSNEKKGSKKRNAKSSVEAASKLESDLDAGHVQYTLTALLRVHSWVETKTALSGPIVLLLLQRFCTVTNEFENQIMADVDPMDAIPPSDVNGHSEAGQLEQRDDQAPAGVYPHAIMHAVPQTPEAIRALLGRKQRKRPLLCIKCKGCGCTTHDEDPFVKGDPVECLDLA
eukprot:s1849_g6.t1